MANLKDAMKAGPAGERRKDTIRFVRAAIHNAQIDRGRPLTDAEVEEVLRHQVKQRRDSIEAFTQGGRPEAGGQRAGRTDHYPDLPAPADERRRGHRRGPRGHRRRRGHLAGRLEQVMPVIMARLKGQAEGRAINQVVRRLLGG